MGGGKASGGSRAQTHSDMTSQQVFNVLVALPVLVFLKYAADWVPYFNQGFFCDDEEIRFPFKENTVQSSDMNAAFIVISVCLMTLSEYSLIRHISKKGKRVVTEDRKVHPIWLQIIFFLMSVFCSQLCVTATVSFAKRTVSRLRPNFISVCQPNLTELCLGRPYEFIEHYRCHGKFTEDEYFSFPSGHAASAVGFVTFMILYLQKRYKFKEPSRSFIQLTLFLGAMFICLSRVRDYKHRLSDVMGGVAVGLLFAWFFIRHVLHDFRHSRYPTTECLSEPKSADYSAI